MASQATPSHVNLAMRRFYSMLSILGGVVALDQATKWWIMESFRLHELREVIPGFFNLVYLHNSGAAFSLLASAEGAWKKWFFIAVAVGALAFILVLFKQYCLKNRDYTVALGLIAGGAVGNLIDRLRFGSVVDFLDFYLAGYHWPAFNVADSAICIGVGLFLYRNLRDGNPDKI
ncbi:MAG: signal peptidase II [Deltaproteobacteria bacterium]|jgi:signal peptidase II|nr:signal peptidase II [Deltaproteobacteria bacterium]